MPSETPPTARTAEFVLNENHWSAWSVRDPPSRSGRHARGTRGFRLVLSFVAQGAGRGPRALRPWVRVQRGEPFSQPTMAVFLCCSRSWVSETVR
ncbi:MAG: hypothetical protein MZV70_22525 [Desulfobacterales bacterium]|nr:hypothetical protein [Desulfobacterales bacterium]